MLDDCHNLAEKGQGAARLTHVNAIDYQALAPSNIIYIWNLENINIRAPSTMSTGILGTQKMTHTAIVKPGFNKLSGDLIGSSVTSTIYEARQFCTQKRALVEILNSVFSLE